MDAPEFQVEEKADYILFYFIYGFLALLGISIMFSLAKVIYHYYKIRSELNVATTEDSIDTEVNSISSEPSIRNEQIENNVNEQIESNESESDKLRVQLDKLGKLLNRLSAMGTFSRDTIGDLSAQSAAYLNNSRAASSDMSAFWSSIDFDDLEESTINEGNFYKTPTEKSVSPSISDFSLDTSGQNFDIFRQKNIAGTSKEKVSYTSAFNNHTNPSDAIAQILTILDSMRLKNKPDVRSLANDTLKNESSSDEDINVQTLSRSVHSVESYVSQKRSIEPLCSDSKDNKFSRYRISNLHRITIDEYNQFKSLNDENKSLDSLTYEPKDSGKTSNVIMSECKIPSTLSMTTRITNGISVANISSSSGSKTSSSKMSSSTKSLDIGKLSISPSVAICIDPFPSKISKINHVESSACTDSNVTQSMNRKIILSEPLFRNISPLKKTFGDVQRYRSFSNLIDKKLQFPSIRPHTINIGSNEKEQETLNSHFENISQIVITNPKISQDPQYYPAKNTETLNIGSIKCERMQPNKKLSSISYRSLYSPVPVDTLVMKSSVSESEIKQPHIISFSRTFSSSSSETFLSPIITESPQSINWTSPAERIANFYVSPNLTPHNENAMFARHSCVWSTPPSPKEGDTDVILVKNV